MPQVRYGFLRQRATVFLICLLFASASRAAPKRPDIGQIKLSGVVSKLLDDPTLSRSQRRHLRVFHGQWDGLEHLTTTEQAQIALARWELSSPVLADASVPAAIRAEAALRRGEPERSVELLRDATTAESAVTKA